jgi:hypothetical protein
MGPQDLDGALARVARGQGALDLALGEVLLRLFAGTRLLDAGYSTERDYARERLGIPVRTMYEWLGLGRVCDGRPLLRKAVASALVSPCKARALAAVVGANEPGWTALAMTSTLREIRAAVRAAGKEAPEEFESESLRIRMSPAQQDRLDRALDLAAATLGGGAPRWQCLEAIAQEWLGEHGEWAPEEEEGGRGGEEEEAKPLPECVAEHLAAIAEAEARIAEAEPGSIPEELDASALRLVRARRSYDLSLGALALRVVDGRVWAAVGYRTLEEYATERLGMTPSVFRQRVWLERRMFALPLLREALAKGILSYSKAVLVAREATPKTVADLIERARGTTWQQTERKTSAREEKRNRARGLRRLWAPKEAARTVVAAILSAQRRSASEGKRIDAGEALARISDHFVEVWSKHRRRRASRARAAVFERHGGCCAVPGCSLRAHHIHHIRYRSQGGTDDAWNQVALCAPHHLRGIHEGRLKVSGRAGERLTWIFGNGEIWETLGDDHVRRADAGCVAERAPRYEATLAA